MQQHDAVRLGGRREGVFEEPQRFDAGTRRVVASAVGTGQAPVSPAMTNLNGSRTGVAAMRSAIRRLRIR
jgi:hypothetical protein